MNNSEQTISISRLRNELGEVIAVLVVFNKIIVDRNILNYLQTNYEFSNREKKLQHY